MVIGQVKWWNNRLGFGFITRVGATDMTDMSADRNTDIFVHHTGIKPMYANYRSLQRGEYVQFSVRRSDDGAYQAVDVTGVGGGMLMCDVVIVSGSRSTSTSQRVFFRT